MENPEVIETLRDLPPDKMGGAIDGDIAVRTSVLIVPPCMLKSFYPLGITLNSRHIVPFTYVVLPPKS